MRTYSVHSRPGESLDGAIFIKQGFSWPAFLFSIPWCLWHRLWVAAALMFAVLAVFGSVFSGASAGILTLAVYMIFGWEANEFKRWSLSARGFRETAILPGANLEDAELRYFASAPGFDVQGAGHAPKLRQADQHEPLGLFGTA